VDKLKRGAEIVVACPGRLLDHIGQKTIDLSRLEMLVLDEADHMFDMGFLPDIRQILRQLPQRRQTLLFSATMPEEIRHLANDVLNEPVMVKVGMTARQLRSVMPFIRLPSTSRRRCFSSCFTIPTRSQY